MLTKTEIPKIGEVYDKLGHSLIILNEDLEIDYINRCAQETIDKLKSNHAVKKWKSIPGRISQKRVFFLVDRDTTPAQEVWIKMQIENNH